LGPDEPHSNGPSRQISQLHPCRIGFLVGKDDFEVGQSTMEAVIAIDDAKKLYLELTVFLSASPFEYEMGDLVFLLVRSQKLESILNAEAKGEMIRIFVHEVFAFQAALINDGCDDVDPSGRKH
jgi:hypothetical protein